MRQWWGGGSWATLRQRRTPARRYGRRRFWAGECTFINPRWELLTRADRLANLRAGRTAFDFLGPVLVEERIRTYGHKEVVAVHTTLLSIGGRYSGRTERAQYLATPSGPPPRRLGAGHQSVDADQ